MSAIRGIAGPMRPARSGTAWWLAALALTLFEPAFAAPESTVPVRLDVRVEDGRVWLDAENAPLTDTLEAIATQAGFTLHLKGEIDSRVTRRFEATALTTALRKLAGAQILVMRFSPRQPSTSNDRGFATTPRTVRVYAKTAGGAPTRTTPARGARPEGGKPTGAPVQGDGGGTITALRRTLQTAHQPNDRRDAIIELIALGQPRALDAIALGLADPVETVRQEAVEAIADFDLPKATQYLGQAALGDQSARIRYSAVELLGARESDAANALLIAATKDTDAGVRELAQSLVAQQ